MKLFGFALSSAAYRVRIALNLKSISYELVSLKLREGEHRREDYMAINPQGLVPALALSGDEADTVLFQSTAILEYLDEVFPEPPLLPRNPVQRARVRAVADNVACDIHPLNNLRILLYLKNELGHDDDTINTKWYHHWLAEGFNGIERSIDGAGSASATSRPWRMSACCRRSTTPAASSSIWSRTPGSARSRKTA